MKTNKELLIRLRTALESDTSQFIHDGMCSALAHLWHKDVITEEEYRHMLVFLDKRRPKITTQTVFLSAWWWKVYDLRPRISFLTYLIAEEEHKEKYGLA